MAIDWFGTLTKGGSHNSTGGIPSAVELWMGNGTLHVILLWMAVVAALMVCVLCGLHLYCVVRYTSKENLRSNMYFLIFMCPVTAVSSAIGMFIPRSSQFLYTVNLSYYMLCLFMVVNLMFSMFGSRRALVRYLKNRGKLIRLAVPPFFKCCKCLPVFRSTHRNLTVIEGFILQTVIVRMILQVADLVVFFELEGSRDHLFFRISHGIGLLSMFTAFYFVYVIIDLGQERLAPYKFATLFRVHDMAQTMSSLQKFFLDFLVVLELIPGTDIMSANSCAMYYLNFALCLEMLVLSLTATFLLHPSKTILFDRYQSHSLGSPKKRNNVIQISTTSMDQENLLNKLDPPSSEPATVKNPHSSITKRSISTTEKDYSVAQTQSSHELLSKSTKSRTVSTK